MEDDSNSLEGKDENGVQPESTDELNKAAHESLEGGPASESSGSGQPVVAAPKPPKGPGLLRRLFGRFNVFLLLFVLLIILGGIVVGVAYIANRNASKPNVKQQALTEQTLHQLAQQDVTVGKPKQVLNVQSNAVFAGKVLINDDLEVAGSLKVGSSLNLPGITVSGDSSFDQIQIKNDLGVGGNGTIQGQLTVQQSLSVGGNGTFGGRLSAPQVTTNTLQINGDLNLTHHISAGGVSPGRSNGSALGAGGTSSVNGSDTAGSININTGSGAPAGCFITVLFQQPFNATPHVLITPVGVAAAGLQYYINRNTSSFSVCTANTPPSNASFGFDYFVLD